MIYKKGDKVWYLDLSTEIPKIKQAVIVDGIIDVNGLITIKEDTLRSIHVLNLYNTPQEAFNYALRRNKW